MRFLPLSFPSSNPERGLNPLYAILAVLSFKISVRSGLDSFSPLNFWIFHKLVLVREFSVISQINKLLKSCWLLVL